MTITSSLGPDGYTVSIPAPVSGGSYRDFLRYEAAVKYIGTCSNGGFPYNQSTGLSSADITTTVKLEIECDFYAVRLALLNRSTAALTGNTAVVGVSETNSTATSQLMGSPTIGGVSYQQIAPAGTVNGWQSVTWSGASSVTVPAATAMQTFALSDWIPLASVPRADGGARPLLMHRTWRGGATGGNWSFNLAGTGARTSSTPMRGRTVVVCNAYSDAITTLTATQSLTTTIQPVVPILRFALPVFSVWGCGDSTMQNNSQAEENLSAWGMRACADVSTPALPVIWANFGASGQRSWTAIEVMRAALQAGFPPPSAIVIQVASVNDPTTAATLTIDQRQRQLANLADVMALAKQYGVGYIIIAPLAPHNALNASNDAFRKETNTLISSAAATNGIRVLNFAAEGDGASPERWVTAYNDGTGAAGDGIHPDADAFEIIRAPALAAALAQILA